MIAYGPQTVADLQASYASFGANVRFELDGIEVVIPQLGHVPKLRQGQLYFDGDRLFVDPATRVAMKPSVLATLLAELGVPAGYGTMPPLPLYAESRDLIDVGPNIVGRMQTLEPVAAAQWTAMQSAAADDGVALLLVSGFRSFEYQAELIRRKLNSGLLIGDILQVNAAPGYSQHHTGRALDIATPGSKPLLEEFEHTAAFAWLQVNAGRFAFGLSYPRDNPAGIAYEPWHWYLRTEDDND